MTRRVLALIGTLSILGGAGQAAAGLQARVEADWPQFMFGPARGGYNPVETTLSPSNVSDLVQKWTVMTPDGIFASPAELGGTLFVPSAARIWAIDADTGIVLWRSKPGGVFHNQSSPAVGNGLVYIPSFYWAVHALDVNTGETVWSYPLGGAIASPLLAGDVVYAASFYEGLLVALDALTGTELWTASIGAEISSSPMLFGSTVYVPGDDGRIHGFDESTGASTFLSDSCGASSSIFSSPVVFSNSIIVGCPGGVYAFDLTSGSFVWKAKTYDAVEDSPALADGVVFVGSLDKRVYAIDASTGDKLWRTPLGSGIESSPAVANGVVYITTDDLHLYALDAKTGLILARLPINNAPCIGSPPASPIVVNGRVDVDSADCKVYSFGL